MALLPEVLNLVWHNHHFQCTSGRNKTTLMVATCETNTIDNRPNIPAVILFPALLTPCLHVRGDNGRMIDILVAAPKSPALTAEHVNGHLKLVPGLDARKAVSDRKLFQDPRNKIIVTSVTPDKFGRLHTDGGFHGMLHTTISNWLPKELDAFYAIQIHESCLPARGGVSAPSGPVEADEATDYQDFLLHGMLCRLNGEALRDQGGRGTHEFVLKDDGVDYSQVNLDRPIVAHHPLYVYTADALNDVTYGHVSDIHLNARQRLFTKSPARVIDAESGIVESPPIGPMVSVFDLSFKSILKHMQGKVDVLLLGGDFIEHIDNAYPYGEGADLTKLKNPNAATIWDLVDVGKKYDQNYQAYVDFIAFFTTMRDYSEHTPTFAVSGNHDCYKNGGIYGISPRALGLIAANEGIPADHNLTFYEAILMFGESYAKVSIWPFMKEKYLEWFFAVLTPFSDFRLELPTQNLVGLHWGSKEKRFEVPPKGHGPTHLGRAEEAVTENQLALLGLLSGSDKKTVLMTHFTLVSYKDEISCGKKPVVGHIDVGGTGFVRKGQAFSENDWGTFDKGRAALYAFVADHQRCAVAVTGHSHRKGLYFLSPLDGDRYRAEANALRTAHDYVKDAASTIGERTPILVSDCGGPLPRLNLEGEFGEWGSDAPSGTLMKVSPEGTVTKIEVVPSDVAQAKPRLAVALDYLHVMKDEVFDKIEVAPFDRAEAETARHKITFTFHKKFPDEIAKCLDVVLFGRPTLEYEWRKIVLKPSEEGFKTKEYSPNHSVVVAPAKLTLAVPEGQAREFYEWLSLGPRSGRFVSFGFDGTTYFDKIYDTQSRWNFAVEAKPSLVSRIPLISGLVERQSYEIMPRGNGDGGRAERGFDRVFRPETPDFVWRRQAKPAVYGDKRR